MDNPPPEVGGEVSNLVAATNNLADAIRTSAPPVKGDQREGIFDDIQVSDMEVVSTSGDETLDNHKVVQRSHFEYLPISMPIQLGSL